MTTQNTEKSKKKYGIKHLILGLAIFFFFIMIFALGNSEDNHSSQTQQISIQKQDETLDDFGAYLQGQYYVKQTLKSPATANFPPLDFLVNRLDDNRFEVVSYVDSQNSFGALLRTDWNVVFQHQNGKTYLEKMVLNGKVVYPVEESDAYKQNQEIQKEAQRLLDQIDSEQEKLKSWGY
jgi:hypothetical protein